MDLGKTVKVKDNINYNLLPSILILCYLLGVRASYRLF